VVASITGSSDYKVSDAQEWYNKSRQETFAIGLARVKSSKRKFSAKPDWKHAYGVKYDGYTAVHTPLNTMGKFSFVTPENKQAYEATGDARYINTFTQMVVINEKKKNRTYAFLMTLVPDKVYLESTHFAAFSSNYRKWQKGYSGYVYYHTIDGRFNNGWKFENGKVIKRVTQVDENGIDISMGVRRKVSSQIVCNTYQQEIYSQNCNNGYTTYEYQGTQNYSFWSNCSSWYFDGYQYFTECYDDGTGGGGGGGDGGQGGGGGGGGDSGAGSGTSNGGYTAAAVGTRTNCDNLSATNTTYLNYVLTFNGTACPTSNVGSYVNTLRDYATTSSVEQGFCVNYDSGQYWMYDNNQNGVFCSGTQNQVSLGFSNNTYLAGHTHVYGDLTTPSPKDVIWLCNAYLGGATNINANVVFAYDGSESAIYVNNPVLFEDFCESLANDPNFTNIAGAYFPVGSEYEAAYNVVNNQLRFFQGFSESVANSYALTYVLDHYNTGLKIGYRPNSTSQYKEQYTEDNQSYQFFVPQICP